MILLKSVSCRARFVITLSVLAAIYGAILTYRLIGFQTDAISDILKFSSLVFILTLCASFIWWTILRLKFRETTLGFLAGGLTAITIMPLPTFIGGFKSTFQAESFHAESGIINALISAGTFSLSTLSLAEFLAIPLSIVVGIWASKS